MTRAIMPCPERYDGPRCGNIARTFAFIGGCRVITRKISRPDVGRTVYITPLRSSQGHGGPAGSPGDGSPGAHLGASEECLTRSSGFGRRPGSCLCAGPAGKLRNAGTRRPLNNAASMQNAEFRMQNRRVFFSIQHSAFSIQHLQVADASFSNLLTPTANSTKPRRPGRLF
jgi:hypothetical protein